MHLDWDTLKYILVLPLAWVFKLIWTNHKTLNELKYEIAAEYPTWTELKREIQGCSDQKDRMIKDQKEDLVYIRAKIDMLVQRELDKK